MPFDPYAQPLQASHLQQGVEDMSYVDMSLSKLEEQLGLKDETR